MRLISGLSLIPKKVSAAKASGDSMPRAARPQWHYIYYSLAAFVLLTIFGSLYLTHRVSRVFSESVQANQEWADRRGRYSELRLWASMVSASADNIFETQDAAGESMKMTAALGSFNEKLAEERRGLVALGRPEQARQLLEDLDSIQRSMDDLAASVRHTLAVYAAGQTRVAGQTMAIVDRKLTLIHQSFSILEEHAHQVQGADFERQMATVRSLQKFEMAVAGCVVLLVFGVTLYGHLLSRQARTSALEHEQYVAALQASEERHRELFESANDIIYSHDRDGNFTSLNPAGERILGYTREEFCRLNFSQVVASEYLQETKAWSAQRGGPAEPDASIRRLETIAKDGRRVPLEVSVRMIPQDGKPAGVSGIARDITDRLRAEQELLERNTYLNALIENNPLGLVILDHEHRVQFCNATFEDLFQYSRAELMGKNLDPLIDPGDNELSPAALTSKVESGECVTLTTRRRRKDGTLLDVELHGVPLMIGGKLIGAYALYHDITERKRAEQRLAVQHASTRILSESASLEEAGEPILRAMCETLDWGIGEIWLVDSGAEVVRNVCTWQSPRLRSMEFAERTREMTFARGIGLPGRVWASEKPVWVRDVSEDCNLPRAAILEKAGLHAALALPIQVNTRVIAVFAFFSPEAREPDEALLQMVGSIGKQVGQFVERRRAEQAHRESESRFRRFFNSIPIPTWVYDQETLQFLEVNDAAVAQYHYTRDEFLQMRITDIRPPAEVPKLLKFLKEAPPVHHSPSGWLHCAKGGRQIEVDLSSYQIEFGGRHAAVVVAQDITERRRAEEELRRFFNLSADMLCIAGLDGYFKRVNPAWESTLGYSLEELISRPYLEIVHPDDRPILIEQGRRLAHGNESVKFEHRVICKDGSVRWLMWRATAAPSQRLIYAAARDITADKRAIEELRLLDRAVSSATNGIAITDPTLPDNPIVYVNPAFERITGYSAQEALGRNLRFLHGTKPDQPGLKELREAVHAGRECRVTLLNYRKDGTPYWNELSVSPVRDEQGRLTHYIGVQSDVTERIRAAEELQRYARELEAAKSWQEENATRLAVLVDELALAMAKAEEASRTKGEFLANMSHEIRTPMNGILGMTELTLETDLTSEQREYLSLVKSSAESLLTVINDILDFSKIEAGKLDLEMIDFKLRDSLDDTVKMLAMRAYQKGLELACRIAPDVPDDLKGDPGRMRQVIVNLVGNAIKFTEAGEVVVRVEPRARTEESIELLFSVSDTGIGIPTAKKEKIFEAFEQADGSTTRKYGGTGLGLTISSRLVELMGGRIAVESEPGKGSTFSFTATFGIVKNPAARSEPAEPAVLDNLPVLVVDDNATHRRILEEMLTSWRMKPRLAEGGAAALAALRAAHESGQPISLVLLDAKMPGMDGFALARALQQDPRFAGLSIIMLSSSGQRGDAARCKRLGIAAYLTKPVRQSELLDATLNVLGTHRAKVESPPLVTRHSIREQRKGLKILLAEDNAVNQQVAIRILGSRGHTVVIAGNGREAVEALDREAFDLVLMDGQMPEMNGFEATALIREKEKASGKHVPIIALTAHAMQGDRERFLEAGMDGYVAKPIRPQELFDALQPYVPAAVVPASEENSSGAAVLEQSNPKLNRDAILRRFDGDAGLIREIYAIFQADYPARLTDIRTALAAGDATLLERTAHTLKGSVGNFEAVAAAEAAKKLEFIAKSKNLSQAGSALAELERELARLETMMNALLQEVAP
ncbi:MAG: PAS domain S-box protein [Acidobacteria bacterium]|nr:PAS domain S-box protein [Acidobacteriota bacterium]